MAGMKKEGAVLIGIDIGTTDIGASVIDPAEGTQVFSKTVPGDAAIPASGPYEHMQNADRLAERARELLDFILERYPSAAAIGVSGQMHGIVYSDRNGWAVSPLITWQDGRAGRRTENGESYAEELTALTGIRTYVGCGLATHYYNVRNHIVPETAASVGTVADYAVMRLTGRKRPCLHCSNAASLGCYELCKQRFSPVLSRIGLDGVLPETDVCARVLGEYRGIPIAVAIGDSQASFLGSVRDIETTALVNVGTGGQITRMADSVRGTENADTECRPFVGGKFLLTGSSLCGGQAYALLERFFALYAEKTGAVGPQYGILNRLAREGIDRPLAVLTAFCGTRSDPTARGEIRGIGENNFTPAALTAGVLYGIADELFRMFCEMGTDGITALAASGNAVRENPVLQEILSRKFGMGIRLPLYSEEAASGAALFAGLSVGVLSSLSEVGKLINYKEDGNELDLDVH